MIKTWTTKSVQRPGIFHSSDVISETISLVYSISAPVSTRRLVFSRSGKNSLSLHLLWKVIFGKYYCHIDLVVIKNETTNVFVVAHTYIVNNGKQLTYCQSRRAQNRLYIIAFGNNTAFHAVFSVKNNIACHIRSTLLPCCFITAVTLEWIDEAYIS